MKRKIYIITAVLLITLWWFLGRKASAAGGPENNVSDPEQEEGSQEDASGRSGCSNPNEDVGNLGPEEDERIGDMYDPDADEAKQVSQEQEEDREDQADNEEFEDAVTREKAAILRDPYHRDMVERKAHMTKRSFDQQLEATARWFVSNDWKPETE